MNPKKTANILFWSCILIVLFFFIFLWFNNGLRPWGTIILDKSGQVGDFIGGTVGTVISAAAFYFLYLTLQDQRKAINDQKVAFQKERLETKFFDLIKMHRENVEQMKFTVITYKQIGKKYEFEKDVVEMNSVFKAIFFQFLVCVNDLKHFIRKPDSIYLPEYKQQIIDNPLVKKYQINILHLAKIDICYSIVFYGVSSEGLSLLRNSFKNKYRDSFVDKVLNYISLKPATDTMILARWMKLSKKTTKLFKRNAVKEIYRWRTTYAQGPFTTGDSKLDAIVIGYGNDYIKYYGGHQFRLGHYYRHLFQMVKYINNRTDLKYTEKYEYIKFLRAQLSTYEQGMLFINSLAAMGRVWELNPEVIAETKMSREDFELITKYNLIKNIPGETIYGLTFREFYPNVEYENIDTKLERFNYT